MGYIISVYTKNAFKYFNLPVLSNSDYRIILAGKEFSLSENIVVEPEVLDNNRRLVKTDGCSIIKKGNDYFNQTIKNGNSLRLITNYGVQLSVIVTETGGNIPVFLKCRLNSDALTIGGSSACEKYCGHHGLVAGSAGLGKSETHCYRQNTKVKY